MDADERPWGTVTVIDGGVGYQVKRLSVRPQRRLSLQSHQHRSEHWIVASGVGRAVVGDTQVDVVPGASVDIPAGTRHRLANVGDVDLVVLEMARGDYFGEEDIHRYEDDFGRC